jgi:hypothetical protein
MTLNKSELRLAIRGWKTGEDQPLFEDRLTVKPRDIDKLLPQYAARHGRLLAETGGMVEIEFLDEPNPEERYFRFGTDPSKMVAPVAVDLKNLGKPQ